MLVKRSKDELAASLNNIIANEQGNITATAHISENFCAFKGHFPNEPVLPGICQIQLVSVLISKVFNQEFSLKEIRRVKFYNIVCPDDCLNIKCDIVDKISDSISLKVMIYKKDESGSEHKVSLIKAIFQLEDKLLNDN